MLAGRILGKGCEVADGARELEEDEGSDWAKVRSTTEVRRKRRKRVRRSNMVGWACMVFGVTGAELRCDLWSAGQLENG